MDDIKKVLSIYNNMESFIPKSDTKYIYHYTSPNGLKGILTDEKLHFTDRNFLNDASEGSYVLDLVINNTEKVCVYSQALQNDIKSRCIERKDSLISEHFHTYQCSFSTNEDSLCMWYYYTKSNSIKGYNIAFETPLLLESLLPQHKPDDGKYLKPMSGSVIYNEKDQLDIIKLVIDAFEEISEEVYNNHYYVKQTVDLIIDKILSHGMFFKMPYFIIEEEFRIVYVSMIFPDMAARGIPTEEKFREVRGYFIPYIERSFNPQSISEIRMSPTLDIKQTQASLQRLLPEKYSHVNIQPSNIPVRY